MTEKAIDNVVKHGVTFGEATDIVDAYAIEISDSDHSSYESCFAIIGCCMWFMPKRLIM